MGAEQKTERPFYIGDKVLIHGTVRNIGTLDKGTIIVRVGDTVREETEVCVPVRAVQSAARRESADTFDAATAIASWSQDSSRAAVLLALYGEASFATENRFFDDVLSHIAHLQNVNDQASRALGSDTLPHDEHQLARRICAARRALDA